MLMSPCIALRSNSHKRVILPGSDTGTIGSFPSTVTGKVREEGLIPAHSSGVKSFMGEADAVGA